MRSVLIEFCRFEGEEREINQSATADAAPIIALSHASKSYGAVRAAKDVAIVLRAGEVRALAGENGAGKSTIVQDARRASSGPTTATCWSTARR